MFTQNYAIQNRSVKLIAAFSLAIATMAIGANKVIASGFEQTAIDPSKVAAITSPYGEGEFQLVVLEQITDEKQCWSETGGPVNQVEPLLQKFTFTNICGRATDSNGYSIRLGSQDLGWRYSLNVVQRDGEMLLVGRSTSKRQQMTEFTIGRIKGTTDRFAKFELMPGWKIAKRSYEGKVLGHYYFANEQSLASLTNQVVSTNSAQ